MVSFAARPADHGVLVAWETASEDNNVGFHLYRSTEPAVQGERVNGALIPSEAPGGGQGAHYEFIDAAAQPHVTYYYTLENVDFQGRQMPYGLVHVTIWPAYLPLVVR